MKLNALTQEMVERAVSIYQDLAYGSVAPKRKAAGGDGGNGPLGLFHREQVECVPGHECQRFSMRLGNRNYPFMKLLLQEHLIAGEFFFAVDTHDQMEIGPEFPDYEQWMAVRKFNGELKRRIEDSFEQAGLDTASVVRKLIVQQCRDDGKPCRGLVLIVDDEEDLAAAVEVLIQRAGFRTCTVHDGRSALVATRELRPDLILLDEARVREPLLSALTRADEDSGRLKHRIADIFAKRSWPVGDMDPTVLPPAFSVAGGRIVAR